MSLGGRELCDDCAWQHCSAVGFCLRPFVSPVALLGLPLTPLETVQVMDELAEIRADQYWIAYDPGAISTGVVVVKSRDCGKTFQSEFLQLQRADHASLAKGLATVSLTGAGESPVAAPALPAAPLDGDGAPDFSNASASPVPTGTTC